MNHKKTICKDGSDDLFCKDPPFDSLLKDKLYGYNDQYDGKPWPYETDFGCLINFIHQEKISLDGICLPKDKKKLTQIRSTIARRICVYRELIWRLKYHLEELENFFDLILDVVWEDGSIVSNTRTKISIPKIAIYLTIEETALNKSFNRNCSEKPSQSG